MTTSREWTSDSVRRFAGDLDPIEAMESKAREVALMAMDLGWSGPPFDPVRLAELLGIDVEARDDVKDARLVPQGQRYKIQFNPSRPRGRIHFSIAHEISHTYFPDASHRIQHRQGPSALHDDWQVEMLCNIGAAELLMPVGSFQELSGSAPSIESLLDMRKELQVSAEALFIRYAKLSKVRCAAFSASGLQARGSDRYRLDYVIGSPSWSSPIETGELLPEEAAVHECVALGFTAKGSIKTPTTKLRVEAVGLPPYPSTGRQRAAGLIWQADTRTQPDAIHYLRGDALSPRGQGQKLLVQVVNDQTTNWGGAGFAAAVKKKWPDAHRCFVSEVHASGRQALRLGSVSEVAISDNLHLISIVAQRGYGPSDQPRIRYAALRKGLEVTAERAATKGATVHMPRLGTGNAGGSWDIVSELIKDLLVRRGIEVTVYDLPS